MPILRRLMFMAGKQLASDPRARQRAAEVYRDRVRPRAEEAYRQARPKWDAARNEVRAAARESDPRHDPRGFAASMKRRFIDRGRDDPER